MMFLMKRPGWVYTLVRSARRFSSSSSLHVPQGEIVLFLGLFDLELIEHRSVAVFLTMGRYTTFFMNVDDLRRVGPIERI